MAKPKQHEIKAVADAIVESCVITPGAARTISIAAIRALDKVRKPKWPKRCRCGRKLLTVYYDERNGKPYRFCAGRCEKATVPINESERKAAP